MAISSGIRRRFGIQKTRSALVRPSRMVPFRTTGGYGSECDVPTSDRFGSRVYPQSRCGRGWLGRTIERYCFTQAGFVHRTFVRMLKLREALHNSYQICMVQPSRTIGAQSCTARGSVPPIAPGRSSNRDDRDRESPPTGRQHRSLHSAWPRICSRRAPASSNWPAARYCGVGR